MKLCSLLLIIMPALITAQNNSLSYQQIRSKYEKSATDDSTAMPWVQKFIRKARAEQNCRELVQGYRDALQFSPEVNLKLKYADSTILAAKRSHDSNLLANAYLGKGIVYYFNLKKFNAALDHYLTARQYAAKTDDLYTQYKILYHIGVVRSYLGNYTEAAENFEECIVYHKKHISANIHPNVRYNSTKAMLNAMHQLAVCYRSLAEYKKADSMVNEGLGLSKEDSDFLLEHAYFNKCRGISEYRKKNYNDAVWYLNTSIPQIQKRNDFAWLSVIYFYLGEIYRTNSNQQKALSYFQKIDSLYTKHDFILPEVRPAYEQMIKYYQNNQQEKKALYYSNQLINADRSMQRDFAYLFSKISRDYDKQNFLYEKKIWQKKNAAGKTGAVILLVLMVCLISVLVWRRRKEKNLMQKYRLLKDRWEAQDRAVKKEPSRPSEKKSRLTEQKYAETDDKIKVFEKEKMYLEKGITVDSVAKKLGTNEAYLSRFINDTKGISFPRYVDELRIAEIIRMMNENHKMLNFNMKGLSETVGYGTRQKFAKAFMEVTGMKPSEFIELRKHEKK